MKGYVVKDGFPDTKPDLDEDEDIAEYRCYDSDAFRAVVDEYLSYPSGSQKREQFIKARKEYVKAVQEVSLCSIFYLGAILRTFVSMSRRSSRGARERK